MEATRFPYADLRRANLEQSRLEGTDFENANLEGARLYAALVSDEGKERLRDRGVLGLDETISIDRLAGGE